MKKSKTEDKKADEPKQKKHLPKKKYIVSEEVHIGKTTYKEGDNIYLTKEGRKYLKSINKIK